MEKRKRSVKKGVFLALVLLAVAGLAALPFALDKMNGDGNDGASVVSATVQRADISRTVSGAGTHALAWTFTRDDYDEDETAYENAAWVDGVVWTPTPVTVAFDDGEAETTLTVKGRGLLAPKTGDGGLTPFWVLLMALGAGGIAFTALGGRRYRRPKYVGKH